MGWDDAGAKLTVTAKAKPRMSRSVVGVWKITGLRGCSIAESGMGVRLGGMFLIWDASSKRAEMEIDSHEQMERKGEALLHVGNTIEDLPRVES